MRRCALCGVQVPMRCWAARRWPRESSASRAGSAATASAQLALATGMLTGGSGPSAEYEVTAAGTAALAEFGVDEISRARRRFAGACLDWTQRRPHLSGVLGAAITTRLLQLSWLGRRPSRRAVRVTEAGGDGLAATSGWSPAQ
jgi:hypothetical protein